MAASPQNNRITAVEFFSGIGAFAAVATEFGIENLVSFDQSEESNLVYFHNHGRQPSSRNLDTISDVIIPTADLWWLSPPCQPYTRRGKMADLADPRSKALQHLIRIILPRKTPRFIALENVEGFAGSNAENLLLNTMLSLHYKTLCLKICSSRLGAPMQRPRLIYLASRDSELALPELHDFIKPQQTLSTFLRRVDDEDPTLRLDPETYEKYLDSLNIIDSSDALAKTICFTSGYGRSLKASGSYVQLKDGAIRYFSPEEILSLLGFPHSFNFPEYISRSCRWRLAGNSVDLRCIRIALQILLPASHIPADCLN